MRGGIVETSASFEARSAPRSYPTGVNISENYQRTAIYVDKILKGAAPGDLPIEFPTKLERVTNLKTAKALGITVPPTLLVTADEVIE
jgi:putative ABC transport system substrate-binding protein